MRLLGILLLIMPAGCALTRSSLELETSLNKPVVDSSDPQCQLTARLSIDMTPARKP